MTNKKRNDIISYKLKREKKGWCNMAKITKAENAEFVRNKIMDKVLDGVGDFSRIDTGAIVFQVDDMEDNSRFVEVRFIVKSEEFDVFDAMDAYNDKVAKAIKRKAEADAVRKKKAEKSE